MYPRFILFGPSHLIVIGLTLLVPLALVVIARLEHPGRRADRIARFGLALFLILGWVGWYTLSITRNTLDLDNGLPFNLCDWASMALIVALLTRWQFAYELGFFWGLGGTLQGLITPTLYYDFPDPQFFFFFVQHSGIIASLLYLTLGTHMRPVMASLWRVMLASFAYLAVAGVFDWLLGTNYGFLRAKPLNASLLTLLSPWPWYIPELVAIGLASLLVYYVPFAVADGFKTSRRPPV